MNTKRGVWAMVREHVYVLIGSGIVLASLLAVGFALASHSFLATLLSVNNHNALLFFRLAFYLCVYCLWPYLLRYCLKRSGKCIKPTPTQAMVIGRKQLVLMIVLFELLIVQGLVAWAVNTIWMVCYGR